ncbi:MAG TPA: hypothetical protein VHV78_00955, partial [Gemmatimonadaceae bacterium]|nr:hypothetical protein [Gemmatimonadaceae bacterium]
PEGLVEAQPRYTALIVAAAFGVGVVIAVVIALSAERLATLRRARGASVNVGGAATGIAAAR